MHKDILIIELRNKLHNCEIHDIGDIIIFDKFKNVTDETTKILIKDKEYNNAAFAIVSNPRNPDTVKRGVDRAEAIKKMLPAETGKHIIDHICTGNLDGSSYAIWPLFHPLSDNRILWYYQRKRLSSHITAWLHDLAERTATAADTGQIADNFVNPLIYLSEMQPTNQLLQRKAEESLRILKDKNWKPVNIVAHNDFWKGNILLDKTMPYPPLYRLPQWVVIDWSGSQIHGYPVYDLIRFAQSFKLSTGLLRKQLVKHCEILHCDLRQAGCYLVASIAHLAINRENFPIQRLIEMACSCLLLFDKACE